MIKSEIAAQARNELDRKFGSATNAPLFSQPRSGWIRSIRTSLGMSMNVLASRLGITQSALSKFEHAELEGRITLAKMNEIASAMDCKLVYALVPNTSLQDIVEKQARKMAAEDFGYVNQTMRLEDQDISSEQLQERIDNHAARLVNSNQIWQRKRDS